MSFPKMFNCHWGGSFFLGGILTDDVVRPPRRAPVSGATATLCGASSQRTSRGLGSHAPGRACADFGQHHRHSRAAASSKQLAAAVDGFRIVQSPSLRRAGRLKPLRWLGNGTLDGGTCCGSLCMLRSCSVLPLLRCQHSSRHCKLSDGGSLGHSKRPAAMVAARADRPADAPDRLVEERCNAHAAGVYGNGAGRDHNQ